MDILPHRSPFLLIDTVEELQPGVKCVAKKNVTMNEPHFMGHFPRNPVMPGVLIIEALAQTGAVAILCQDEWKGKTAYFAGINLSRMNSDKEAFEPWFTELTTGNPLNFPEYEEKIAKTQEKKQDFLRVLSSVRQRFTARRQCLV